MDALRIHGGAPLSGEVRLSGSKNATLPIMAAALLAPGESVLENVPDLADVATLSKVLGRMGVRVRHENRRLSLDATYVDTFEASYDLVRTMRASILVLGPLVARFGQARVSLPGGCAIGARPIDQHLKGLARLGASIQIEHGYVVARAERLVGNEIVFDMPTVTGTENLLLAASLAEGTTILENAAREPEVVDLARALGEMGVGIEGAGQSRIVVHGCKQVAPCQHTVVPDRIELGTFLVAGALSGEGLIITGAITEHQSALIEKLRAAGAQIEIARSGIRVSRPQDRPRPVDLQTAPYPGFPTDMQAQLMALLAVCDGVSVVSETIFENRFMHVAELNRLGAAIRVDGGKATVQGVPWLSGSTVMATDLRASACLVLAGLIADGETVVRRIYHLDRGYERIEDKLRQVGACIERFRE
jgi:UDP-N-acetylglucosamine 1-carboxyvinyltransferase